nr:Os09g0265225 [Ipomoea batatas]
MISLSKTLVSILESNTTVSPVLDTKVEVELRGLFAIVVSIEETSSYEVLIQLPLSRPQGVTVLNPFRKTFLRLLHCLSTMFLKPFCNIVAHGVDVIADEGRIRCITSIIGFEIAALKRYIEFFQVINLKSVDDGRKRGVLGLIEGEMVLSAIAVWGFAEQRCSPQIRRRNGTKVKFAFKNVNGFVGSDGTSPVFITPGGTLKKFVSLTVTVDVVFTGVAGAMNLCSHGAYIKPYVHHQGSTRSSRVHRIVERPELECGDEGRAEPRVDKAHMYEVGVRNMHDLLVHRNNIVLGIKLHSVPVLGTEVDIELRELFIGIAVVVSIEESSPYQVLIELPSSRPQRVTVPNPLRKRRESYQLSVDDKILVIR